MIITSRDTSEIVTRSLPKKGSEIMEFEEVSARAVIRWNTRLGAILGAICSDIVKVPINPSWRVSRKELLRRSVIRMIRNLSLKFSECECDNHGDVVRIEKEMNGNGDVTVRELELSEFEKNLMRTFTKDSIFWIQAEMGKTRIKLFGDSLKQFTERSDFL